jgi:hypothetical protein
MCTALEAVLLDPLPLRDFAVDDARLFIHDLSLLKEFFIAVNEWGEPQGVLPYEVDECAGSLYVLLRMMATPSAEIARQYAEHKRFDDDHDFLNMAAKLLNKRTDEAARQWRASHP